MQNNLGDLLTPIPPSVNSDEQVKLRIKQWLKQQGHDRIWLANACNVSKRTVDNWLSSPLPLPKKTLRILDRILSPTPSPASPPNLSPSLNPQAQPNRSISPSQIFSIEIDLDRFRAYSKAALVSTSITTSGADSWVFAAVQNSGTNNSAGTPSIVAPLTAGHSGFWGSQWGSLASGTQTVSTSGTSLTPTFSTNAGSNIQVAAVEFLAVPEPSSALFGGLGVLALLRRRR